MKRSTPEQHRKTLGTIARTVFYNRNAQAMPAKDRAQLNANARPNLRRAIYWARQSREALRVDSPGIQELWRDRAIMYAMFALFEFSAPDSKKLREQVAALARASRDGGAATAEAYATPVLDDLIRACLKRREKTRDYTTGWAGAFDLHASTVRRHIKRIKAELAGG